MDELGSETLSQDILDMLVVVSDLNANGTPALKALAGTIKGWSAAWEADQKRVRGLKQSVRRLPCLSTAQSNGKGIVPVPEWVIADIAAALDGLAAVGPIANRGL